MKVFFAYLGQFVETLDGFFCIPKLHEFRLLLNDFHRLADSVIELARPGYLSNKRGKVSVQRGVEAMGIVLSLHKLKVLHVQRND